MQITIIFAFAKRAALSGLQISLNEMLDNVFIRTSTE